MISRSAIGRNAQLALRRQSVNPANTRGLAASISGSTSFSYDTADVGGVKVASRDVAGPTTKLAVVAKAGTRYQSAPGLTSGLEQFAFKVRCILPAGQPKDETDCFMLLEYLQAICIAYYQRIRVVGRSIECIPHQRGVGD